MGAAIVRQDIITWYRPEEKMPPENQTVVVTFSGKVDGNIYINAIGTAIFYAEGWEVIGVDNIDCNRNDNNITIEAWCDIDPYWDT